MVVIDHRRAINRIRAFVTVQVNHIVLVIQVNHKDMAAVLVDHMDLVIQVSRKDLLAILVNQIDLAIIQVDQKDFAIDRAFIIKAGHIQDIRVALFVKIINNIKND